MTADSHILLRALVNELARCGATDACTSPGSRSTPVVLALAAHEGLRAHSHLDERVAGFFALGLAKATARPVLVACTSGTAAAELAPAVHEAHEARVPLIVLTADRPPELRDTGAGQTIDQVKLYGDAAKWFVEVGVHDTTPERLRWVRTLACRAYWTALAGRPGPVHLNLPLREPLVPPADLPPVEASGRPGGRPWLTRPAAQAVAGDDVLESLRTEISARPHGVVVAGRAERDPRLGRTIAEFAARAGYPLLADPLSGARRGKAAIAHYDALLRDEGFAATHRPELILRVGDLPTSKPLRQWLAAQDALQIRIDPEDAWQDPDGVTGTLVAADPHATLSELETPRGRLGRVGGIALSFRTDLEAMGGADHGWLQAWRDADQAAAGAIAQALTGDRLTEPRVAAELGVRLPATGTCFVASSMPVRDVETFWPVREQPPRALSNRGANGIDGTVSAAFGAAAAARDAQRTADLPGAPHPADAPDVPPTALLIGDVALAYDVGGLACATRLGLALTIVLVHNDGGGIFHFLPVAEAGEAFERHVATPHGLDFSAAAALYGCQYRRAQDPEALRAALDEAFAATTTTIVEVRTDREDNVAVHRRVWDAVSEALAR